MASRLGVIRVEQQPGSFRTLWKIDIQGAGLLLIRKELQPEAVEWKMVCVQWPLTSGPLTSGPLGSFLWPSSYWH